MALTTATRRASTHVPSRRQRSANEIRLKGLSTKDGIEDEKWECCRCVRRVCRCALERGRLLFNENYRLANVKCALFRYPRNVDTFDRGATTQSEIVRDIVFE